MKKIVRKKARKLASNGHHPLRKPTKAKKHRSVSNKVKTKTLTHHEAKKLIGIKRRENRPIRKGKRHPQRPVSQLSRQIH